MEIAGQKTKLVFYPMWLEMKVADEFKDSEIPGLVVYTNKDTNVSRLWLFDKQEVTTDKLRCRPGDWFTCSKVNDEWKFEKTEALVDTRVDGWRVEIKVPVMMYRSLSDDLGFPTSVKLENTLFSPIIGRIGIFMNTAPYHDGVLYEAWATNIPDEQEQCRAIKAKSKICWMVGAQDPVTIDHNSNLDKYDNSCNCFIKIPGIALKIISKTIIIKTRNLGICVAPANSEVKRGDRVEFFPIFTDLSEYTRYILAGNCVVTRRKYMEFVNDYDNEFWVKFTPQQEGYDRKEHEVIPYGPVSDVDELVKPISLGHKISALVRFRFMPEEMVVNFFFKTVKNYKLSKSPAPVATDTAVKTTPTPIATSTPKPPTSAANGIGPAQTVRNEFGDFVDAPVNGNSTDTMVKKTSELLEEKISHGNDSSKVACENGNSNKQNGLAASTAPTAATSASTSTVGCDVPSSVARSVSDILNSREQVGVVAAQTVDAYYVFCPSFTRDVLLPKHLSEFETENRPMNVGQWIRFMVQPTSASDRATIVSFAFINQVYPTMPSFNTIMLECKITVPADYNPQLYDSTVTSEFVPVVGDQDFLIRKCHHGKTLSAVMRRTKTSIPNVFWNIEYIKF